MFASSTNVELDIFTSQSCSDGKEMYKKAWRPCRVVVLPIYTFCIFEHYSCSPIPLPTFSVTIFLLLTNKYFTSIISMLPLGRAESKISSPSHQLYFLHFLWLNQIKSLKKKWCRSPGFPVNVFFHEMSSSVQKTQTQSVTWLVCYTAVFSVVTQRSSPQKKSVAWRH